MAFVESVQKKSAQHIQIREMLIDLASFTAFNFVRYSDGELMMLLGHDIRMTPNGAWIGDIKITSENFKQHDCKTFIFKDDKYIFNELVKSFNHKSINFVRGLPLSCCVGAERFKKLAEIGDCKNLSTTANLLINSNYRYFLNHVAPFLFFHRPVIIIANRRASVSLFKHTIKHIQIGDNCKNDINDIISEVLENLEGLNESARKEAVILSAASYISNIVGYRISRDYPQCTFIDIGTALHPHLELGLPRHYHKLYFSNPTKYTYHECTMEW